ARAKLRRPRVKAKATAAITRRAKAKARPKAIRIRSILIALRKEFYKRAGAVSALARLSFLQEPAATLYFNSFLSPQLKSGVDRLPRQRRLAIVAKWRSTSILTRYFSYYGTIKQEKDPIIRG